MEEEAVAVEEKACGGRNLTREESREEDLTGSVGRVRGEAADNIFVNLGVKLNDEEERGSEWGLYKRLGVEEWDRGWVRNLTRVKFVTVWVK